MSSEHFLASSQVLGPLRRWNISASIELESRIVPPKQAPKPQGSYPKASARKPRGVVPRLPLYADLLNGVTALRSAVAGHSRQTLKATPRLPAWSPADAVLVAEVEAQRSPVAADAACRSSREATSSCSASSLGVSTTSAATNGTTTRTAS
jgi:hypothetical protein